MPSYKNPLVDIPVPTHIDQSTEVYQIRFTGEIFTNYEDYFKRYNLYRNKVWTCEATGKGGLSYEEALRSERETRSCFDFKPQSCWKKPALNLIQFNTGTTPELIDTLNNFFTENAIVGESVSWNDQKAVIVGAQPKIPQITSSDATQNPIPIPDVKQDESDGKAYSIDHYDFRLRLFDQTTNQLSTHNPIILPASKFTRQPFTKLLFKKLVKDSASKGNYVGAPWIVKTHLTALYNISDTPPPSLQNIINKKEKEKPLSTNIVLPGASLDGVIRFPMEDLELPHLAPRPKTFKDGTSIPTTPPQLHHDFGGVPENSVQSLMTTWQFLSAFSIPLKLSPFTLDDYISAITHHKSTPCVLLTESLSSLLSIACIEYSRSTTQFSVFNEPLSGSQSLAKEKYCRVFDGLSTMEQVCINQWWKWYPGRWDDGLEKSRTRGSKLVNKVPGVKRLKAVEVALVGFIRDCVGVEVLPDKWVLMMGMIGGVDDMEVDHVEEKDVKSSPAKSNTKDAAPPKKTSTVKVLDLGSDGELSDVASISSSNGEASDMEETEEQVKKEEEVEEDEDEPAKSSDTEEDDEEMSSDEVIGRTIGRNIGHSVRRATRNSIASSPTTSTTVTTRGNDSQRASPATPKKRGRNSNITSPSTSPPKSKKKKIEKSRTSTAQTIEEEHVEKISALTEAYFLRSFDTESRLIVFSKLVEDHACVSAVLREYVETCVENSFEFRKELKEVVRERKHLATAIALFDKKEGNLSGDAVDEGTDEEMEHSVDASDSDAESSGIGHKSRTTSNSRVEILKREQAKQNQQLNNPSDEKTNLIKERKSLIHRQSELARQENTLQLSILALTSALRARPLGFDRNFSAYYWFDASLGSVADLGNYGDAISQGNARSESGLEWAAGRVFVGKVLEGSIDRKWGWYDDAVEIETLMNYLDTRGIREGKLLASLEKYLNAIQSSMEKRKLMKMQEEEDEDMESAFLDYINLQAQ